MATRSAGPDHHPDNGTGKPKRRRFSDEYKLRILDEADRCTKRGEIGLLLRREGKKLDRSLSTWYRIGYKRRRGVRKPRRPRATS